MHAAMLKRRLKPVIILDLGLPRNVDPEGGLYIPKESVDKPTRKSKPKNKEAFGVVQMVANTYVVVNIDGNNVRLEKHKVSGKMSVGEKIRVK